MKMLAAFIACACAHSASPDPVSYLLGALPEPLKCKALDSICEAGAVRGKVEDCLCEAEDADAENKSILPLLANLTRLAYFHYFKVALDDPCPLRDWPQPTCAVEQCSVDNDECPAAEPVCAADGSVVSDGFASNAALGNVELGGAVPGRSEGLSTWEHPDDAWSEALAGDAGDSHYVDLLRNPEGYTGYGVLDPTDTTAQRLWALLSAQACFSGAADASGEPAPDVCLEERVFQRLVSGLHASVSTHIALTAGNGTKRFTFGAPNASWYVARVGRHPGRLENLYFTFLFVARAVARAGPSLSAEVARRGSGLPEDDEAAIALLARLDAAVRGASPGAGLGAAFDERPLFAAQRAVVARTALPPLTLPTYRDAFRNISLMLNCVGCHKCKLWGKLQFLGVGAAMKILLHDVEARSAPAVGGAPAELHITRNELVALVNVFHRLAISIDAVQRMRELEAVEKLRAGLFSETLSVLGSGRAEGSTPPTPASPAPPAPAPPPPKPRTEGAHVLLLSALALAFFAFFAWGRCPRLADSAAPAHQRPAATKIK